MKLAAERSAEGPQKGSLDPYQDVILPTVPADQKVLRLILLLLEAFTSPSILALLKASQFVMRPRAQLR
ncbi:MAG: hypothetical protein IPJ50_13650 [Betaproteobacteria bacterium]|nr:hypothetical protein [Betaproteobacteria bacterium]